MSGWKFGISAGGFCRMFGDEEGIARLARLGFDAVDFALFSASRVPLPVFMQPRAARKEHFLRLREGVERTGMFVSQTHGLFPLDEYGREWAFDELCKEIEATALLGARCIVVHPLFGHSEEADRTYTAQLNRQFFGMFGGVLKEYGVKMAIENLCTKNARTANWSFFLAQAQEMKEFLEELGEQFVCCFDTGHANVQGDVPAMLRTLGRHVAVMHIHDNDGCSDLHHPPAFGSIDWKETMRALRGIGYCGVLNMEINLYERFAKYGPHVMEEGAALSLELMKHIASEE